MGRFSPNVRNVGMPNKLDSATLSMNERQKKANSFYFRVLNAFEVQGGSMKELAEANYEENNSPVPYFLDESSAAFEQRVQS